MKYYSLYNYPAEQPSCPGEKVTEYNYIDEATGEEVTERWQIYEEIQSNRERVLLSNLLERYGLGDKDALMQKKGGEYLDTTEIPNDLADIHSKSIILNKFKELVQKNAKNKKDIVTDSEGAGKDIPKDTQPEEPVKKEKGE